jgi:hypothetical protein
MKTTIKIGNETIRDELEAVAGRIELVDQSLRENFSGFDVRSILPEVQQSMADAGVHLPDSTLLEYAGAISERQDFEFVLE